MPFTGKNLPLTDYSFIARMMLLTFAENYDPAAFNRSFSTVLFIFKSPKAASGS
jgi:hypothetical protein